MTLRNNANIDVHIHVLPPSFQKALQANGGDPTGWPVPSWTSDECKDFCDSVQTSFAVLSVTAPGASLFGPTAAGRDLARTMNEEVAEICLSSDGRFGFFASLPDWNDVEGTLIEIKRIFGSAQAQAQAQARGVIAMSSYGNKLAGDAAFKPIWDALNEERALVLLHPTDMVLKPTQISDFLPQPVVDFPQATTRAVASLIYGGVLKSCAQVDIILSHAGGTFPFLAERILGALSVPALSAAAGIDAEEGRALASRFYYDVALATSPAQLKALLATTTADHILFGTDFPYAPTPFIHRGFKRYATFVRQEPEGSQLSPEQLSANAVALFAKHNRSNLPAPSTSLFSSNASKSDSIEAAEARKMLFQQM
ncbi:amidohydrolase 2 [Acaromyces ingoldii]|uniref:6-methylsalicylate decarboxylase n=1 Tax=Acaromyces ingoldii TaxID=215250 RepID=A0A316YFB8_9BASI|nr:amidohydrolase 2 [Acaromyces ingoldii]PWN86763.1 amidohydrolase 2 [Acaromyces ingoldii]